MSQITLVRTRAETEIQSEHMRIFELINGDFFVKTYNNHDYGAVATYCGAENADADVDLTSLVQVWICVWSRITDVSTCVRVPRVDTTACVCLDTL